MATYMNCTFNIQNFYSDGDLKNNVVPSDYECPSELNTPQAKDLWKIAQEKGWVDENLQLTPSMTNEKAAIIAERISYKLELKNRWSPFEKQWGISTLQSKYDRAIANQNLRDFYEAACQAFK